MAPAARGLFSRGVSPACGRLVSVWSSCLRGMGEWAERKPAQQSQDLQIATRESPGPPQGFSRV